MRDSDGLRGAVAMLAQDEVGLAATRVVTLERVRPVQQNDDVRVLL